MNVKIYVRALLCLYVSLSVHDLSAQALKAGDHLPPQIWSQPLKVINHPEGKETITLNDYKGKLIILDFWATWCGSCVGMLPKMNSLQKEFEGRLQILPVTYQTGREVSEFMNRYAQRTDRLIALPDVVEDTLLRSFFPHTYLPHYVWINEDGVFSIATEAGEINAQKISDFLNHAKPVMTAKVDPTRNVAYDIEKPLLVNGNGGDGSNLIYHSLLTGYTEGLKGGFSIRTDSVSGRKVTVTNCSRLWLYRLAYAEPGKWFDEGSVVIESDFPERLTSKLSGERYRQWLRAENGYCYELKVPRYLVGETNRIMRTDLEKLFPQFIASVENRPVACLVLEIADSALLPASTKGEPVVYVDPYEWRIANVPLYVLVDRINKLQNYPLSVVDQTGLKYPLTLTIEAGLHDLTKLKQQLALNGLTVTEKQVDHPVLVIRDNPVSGKF